MSEQLREAIARRLAAFAERGDTTAILDASAADEVDQLVRHAESETDDGRLRVDVVNLIAWFHHCRASALGQADGEPDHQKAVHLFRLLAEIDERMVPDELRSTLGLRPAQPTLDELAALVHHATQSDDPAALDAAEARLVAAAAAVGPDDPRWSGLHALRGELLRMRFQREGRPEDIEGSVHCLRQALNGHPLDGPVRASLLSSLGTTLTLRFRHTRTSADLDEAVALIEAALDMVGAHDRLRVAVLANLGTSLRCRYDSRDDPADLDAAIDAAIETTRIAAPVGATWESRSNLANWLRLRHARTGDREDLDLAIRTGRKLLTELPAQHPIRPLVSANYGNAHLELFQLTHDSPTLDVAVAASREGVNALRPGNVDWKPLTERLLKALDTRYPLSRDPVDRDEAIEVCRRLAAGMSPGSREWALMLAALADRLCRRFEETDDRQDFDTAAALLSQAGTAMAGDPVAQPRLRAGFGLLYITRFTRAADPTDLESAIEHFRVATSTLPDDAEYGPQLYLNYGSALSRRWDRYDDVADLDAAITAARQGLLRTPWGSAHRIELLHTLSGRLQDWHYRNGSMAALEEAIDVTRLVVAETPDDDTYHGVGLGHLGTLLSMRFEQTGNAADCDEAVESVRAAVDASRPDDPNRQQFMRDLALVLDRRYERDGRIADLDEAIELSALAEQVEGSRRALAFVRWGLLLEKRAERLGTIADLNKSIAVTRLAVDLPDQLARDSHLVFSNLSNALRRRFELLGASADLIEATDLARRALAVLPADHSSHPIHLANFVAVLLTGEPGDAQLHEAVAAAQAAVNRPTADTAERALYLNSLATALHARYSRLDNAEDLDSAIAVATEAAGVKAALKRPQLYMNLALMLTDRYRRLGSQPDLNDAKSWSEQALALLPEAHPLRAWCFFHRGHCGVLDYARTGDRADAITAVQFFRTAAQTESASVSMRLNAANCWALVANTLEAASPLAMAGYATVVGLLPLLTTRGLGRGDQERLLQKYAENVVDAAACAAAGRQPGTAISLLEQGRALLWSQLLETRTDLTALAAIDPDLGARLVAVRTALDQAKGPSELGLPGAPISIHDALSTESP
jgi:tetratricopeptide (TPR) repeat protein